MLLRHPEADIGGAGEKAGVGEAQQKLGQGLDPARGEPAAAIGGFDLFAVPACKRVSLSSVSASLGVETVAARMSLIPPRRR